MKKYLLTLFIALLWTLHGFGQNDFRFGFQVSPTFTWMQSDDNRINPNGTNFAAKFGMIGEYYFRENYALTGGIGFAFNAGGTLKHDFGGTYWSRTDLAPLDTLPAGVNLKYNLQYLEIPVGLKMRTREFGYISYFAELPIITFGFTTQSRGTIQATGIEETEKINISDEVNTLALSWGAGGGIEYSISTNTSLVAGLYYQKIFTDVTDDNGTVFDTRRGDRKENSKGSINGLTIRLGVVF